MFRCSLMLFLSVCAVTADVLTVRWFFRKLREIQEDFWGKENVKPFRLRFSIRRRQTAKG